jgi:hypothetical protein
MYNIFDEQVKTFICTCFEYDKKEKEKIIHLESHFAHVTMEEIVTVDEHCLSAAHCESNNHAYRMPIEKHCWSAFPF